MDDSPELEHAAKIDRLMKMNPKDIEDFKVQGLVSAIRNKELTEADVLQFTSITPDQLQSFLAGHKGRMD